MSTKDTGGTAFPMQDAQAIHAYACARVVEIVDPNERDEAYLKAKGEAVGGMTLRDYFMANLPDEVEDYGPRAKESIVGRPMPTEKPDGLRAVLEFEAEFRAKWRAIRADAMLKERAE